MWWYRRSSRLIFDAFRLHKSKTYVLGNIRSLIRSSKFFQPVSSNSSGSRISQFSQRRIYSPFFDGAKRFYYVDTNKVHHFKPRGCKHWIQNRRNICKLGLLSLLGCGVVIPAYLWNLESVPYTGRSRFMPMSISLEKKLSELFLEVLIKYLFEGKIVPSHHPESIRVEKIMQNIVEAVCKGGSRKQPSTEISVNEERSRSRSSWFNKQAGKTSANLEEFKWEIILVNQPIVNAFSFFGGKVVIYTGMLDRFRTDDEIAAIIGHEVGHVVARHSTESMCKDPWLAMLLMLMLTCEELIKDEYDWLWTILELIADQIYQYFFPDNRLMYILSYLFLTLPLSRRMETEADYIGLLLMASAGYDPRVAPKMYEKLGRKDNDPPVASEKLGRKDKDPPVASEKLGWYDYYSLVFDDHPPIKKRVQLISQPQVMEEALSLYREAQAQAQAQAAARRVDTTINEAPSILSYFQSFWKS